METAIFVANKIVAPNFPQESPRRMRISLLVPCRNEEKMLRHSIASWLNQSRQLDEIIVVDDSSIDSSPEILAAYSDRIRVIRTPMPTGRKSFAQEIGFRYISGDVVVTTDGDTILDSNFVELIEKDFEDTEVVAVGGYVKSIPYNWLTACRAIDYAVGQNIDKIAQDYLDFMFVIPGAAGAFRVDTFSRLIGFDHDTIAEDLDFTYKFHNLGCKVKYNRRAICWTQDPTDIQSYISQMRRWYAGGWQNLRKHFRVPSKPGMALELSLMYIDGLVFSSLIFVIPLISIDFTIHFLWAYSSLIIGLGFYGAFKERRADVLCVLPWYFVLRYVHAWIYVEQFIKIIILKRAQLVWFSIVRV